jgi:tRNA(adenine34) deaminase
MRRALQLAIEPTGLADVPVGAVVYDPGGRELATARNERELTGDPTAHAEILAIRRAATALAAPAAPPRPAAHARSAGPGGPAGWHLDGCTLVVTLEPCTMCAGALVLARIGVLVFGAWEPRTGAVGSLWDVVRDRRLTHRPEVYSGVLESECAAVLTGFFGDRR